ncbi:hypothetical protein PFISCL1PPCAC_11685, partial [Pristionchus fissidentatus]
SPAVYSVLNNPCSILVVIVFTSLISAVITVVGVTIFVPRPDFTAQVCAEFNEVLMANFCDKVFLGGSVKETLDNQQSLLLLLIFMSGIASAVGLILFFGYKIDKAVSEPKLSINTVSLHKKTMKILIVQVI